MVSQHWNATEKKVRMSFIAIRASACVDLSIIALWRVKEHGEFSQESGTVRFGLCESAARIAEHRVSYRWGSVCLPLGEGRGSVEQVARGD